MRRALLIGIPTLLLVVILVVGLRQAGDEKGDAKTAPTMTKEEVLAPLEGSPPRLAALHAQGSQIKPGAEPAFEQHLKALKGFPVVVNLWASWCGPCRFELPFIQQVSSQNGKSVAYLGVNVGDDADSAERTAKEFFMPYPSIEDPQQQIRSEFGVQGLPATAFYDRTGKQTYLHQGAYTSAEKLQADIAKYTS
ncbi:MAG: TlpA family protein disulfide reductase [Solirubrobacteraceae bacterium]|nr:TlpA family protein disulfide reductase [Solirubrobacteraceae bacterium]